MINPNSLPLKMQTVQVATITFEEVAPVAQIPQTYVEQLPAKRRKIFFGNREEIELEMILIPTGKFLMGSPEANQQARPNEKPQHLVNVPAFYMAKYPITQAQWKAVANLTSIEVSLNESPSSYQGDNYPVEQVSWYDAIEFCARLSYYTNQDYRLPNEAEWEYACRALTSEPLFVTDYHFGNDESQLGNYAWYSQNSNGQTHPVGQKKPNAFGLYDMHGNVWEWCLDQYHESYEGVPTDGSAWVDKSNPNHPRILRGGAWGFNAWFCRCAYRDLSKPIDRLTDFGFRVVCTI